MDTQDPTLTAYQQALERKLELIRLLAVVTHRQTYAASLASHAETARWLRGQFSPAELAFYEACLSRLEVSRLESLVQQIAAEQGRLAGRVSSHLGRSPLFRCRTGQTGEPPIPLSPEDPYMQDVISRIGQMDRDTIHAALDDIRRRPDDANPELDRCITEACAARLAILDEEEHPG